MFTVATTVNIFALGNMSGRVGAVVADTTDPDDDGEHVTFSKSGPDRDKLALEFSAGLISAGFASFNLEFEEKGAELEAGQRLWAKINLGGSFR